MLSGLLERLGCKSRLFLQQPIGAALGGTRDLSGHPVAPNAEAVNLVRVKAPGAKRIFTDTPVVSPDVWAPLQARRVRYFRKPKPKRVVEPDNTPDEAADDSPQHEELLNSPTERVASDETATTSKPGPAAPPARGPEGREP